MHPERPRPSQRSREEIIAALYEEAGERLLAKQEKLRQAGEWPNLSNLTDEEAADDYFHEQDKLYKAVWLEMADEIRIKAETAGTDVELLAEYQIYREIWLKDGFGWPPPDPSEPAREDDGSR
ncbi:MAG: hypothetical protein KDJ97_27200 [Anaerolineae bacterium]|nr:hypothetical protein [Anaerolineae bacterium]